ncbi:mariner transposase [Elysia marginata]|uniref:Mariner transposase n=1 Tax=Elysia marginata TaxID=1093978 RepID=A0AAV4FMP3_9GAST|nr:mariner transposase [Elysia marginata]
MRRDANLPVRPRDRDSYRSRQWSQSPGRARGQMSTLTFVNSAMPLVKGAAPAPATVARSGRGTRPPPGFEAVDTTRLAVRPTSGPGITVDVSNSSPNPLTVMPTPMSIPTCPSVVAPTTAVNPYTPTPLVSVESTVSPYPTVATRMTDVSPHTPLPVKQGSTASKSAPRNKQEKWRNVKHSGNRDRGYSSRCRKESTTSAGLEERRPRRCLVHGCTHEDAMAKPHFFRHHVPRDLNLNSPCEAQVRALKYLAGELGCRNLKTMVTIAFAHQDLRDITISLALVGAMKRLSAFQRWSRPVKRTEWVTRRLPALLLHWRVLGSLINQLTRVQQVAFAHWRPRTNTPMLEIQDSVVEEIDNLLAGEAPGPTANEEAMETESTEPPVDIVNEVSVGSYASVTAQPATVRWETVRDEEPQLYDAHFHLDRRLGKDATVSEMLRMPLSRRPGTTGRLRGGVAVFCDPHSYLRNVDRIVDVPGDKVRLHDLETSILSRDKKVQSAKVMAIVFWDAKGVILLDILSQGQCINAVLYYSTLDRLICAIRRKKT